MEPARYLVLGLLHEGYGILPHLIGQEQLQSQQLRVGVVTGM